MPVSKTLNVSPYFPAGTTVSAYPADITPGTAPPVSASETATVGSDGTVRFQNLAAGRDYSAGAQVSGAWRYVDFDTRQDVLVERINFAAFSHGQTPAWDANAGAVGAAWLPPARITSLEVHGHSWVAGFALKATKYNWINRLAKAYGVTATNTGQSGGMAVGTYAQGGPAKVLRDQLATDLTTGPYMSVGGLKILLTDFNDATTFGTSSNNGLVENGMTLQASRLLAARVMNAQSPDAAITYSAGWGGAADTTVSSGTGFSYALANGETVTIALDSAYNGEAVTVYAPINASDCSGTLTLRLNPSGANTLLGTLNLATYNTPLKAASQQSTVCLRIPAGTIPAGAQTLRLTTSGLTGSNYATFGGVIIEGTAPLLLPLMPQRPSSASTTATLAWCNERIKAVGSLFPNVAYADFAAALSPNYGTASETADERYWLDPNHANELGQGRMYAAALKALGPLLTPDVVGAMS